MPAINFDPNLFNQLKQIYNIQGIGGGTDPGGAGGRMTAINMARRVNEWLNWYYHGVNGQGAGSTLYTDPTGKAWLMNQFARMAGLGNTYTGGVQDQAIQNYFRSLLGAARMWHPNAPAAPDQTGGLQAGPGVTDPTKPPPTTPPPTPPPTPPIPGPGHPVRQGDKFAPAPTTPPPAPPPPSYTGGPQNTTIPMTNKSSRGPYNPNLPTPPTGTRNPPPPRPGQPPTPPQPPVNPVTPPRRPRRGF